MIKTVFTTAPLAYDGFSTTTVNLNVGTDDRGNTIRQVEMEVPDYDWQTDRYRSGMYPVHTPREAQQMFDAGLWVRTEA